MPKFTYQYREFLREKNDTEYAYLTFSVLKDAFIYMFVLHTDKGRKKLTFEILQFPAMSESFETTIMNVANSTDKGINIYMYLYLQ